MLLCASLVLQPPVQRPLSHMPHAAVEWSTQALATPFLAMLRLPSLKNPTRFFEILSIRNALAASTGLFLLLSIFSANAQLRDSHHAYSLPAANVRPFNAAPLPPDEETVKLLEKQFRLRAERLIEDKDDPSRKREADDATREPIVSRFYESLRNLTRGKDALSPNQNELMPRSSSGKGHTPTEIVNMAVVRRACAHPEAVTALMNLSKDPSWGWEGKAMTNQWLKDVLSNHLDIMAALERLSRPSMTEKIQALESLDGDFFPDDLRQLVANSLMDALQEPHPAAVRRLAAKILNKIPREPFGDADYAALDALFQAVLTDNDAGVRAEGLRRASSLPADEQQAPRLLATYEAFSYPIGSDFLLSRVPKLMAQLRETHGRLNRAIQNREDKERIRLAQNEELLQRLIRWSLAEQIPAADHELLFHKHTLPPGFVRQDQFFWIGLTMLVLSRLIARRHKRTYLLKSSS